MYAKWFGKVQYGELYCGPGVLIDVTTGRLLAGSPLEALAVRKRFSLYVFRDFSDDCVEALHARIGHEPGVIVEQGDAKAARDLETFCAHFDARALTVIYLDPARPQDLHWSTVETLARHFNKLDLIINLPVNGLVRAITGAGSGRGRDSAAGRFLNHPDPTSLLQRDFRGELQWLPTINAIRAFYDQQLESLDFIKPARREVLYPGTSPYYDVLYASRHPRGNDLWVRTNPEPENPQLSLLAG
jgi:three-Cys-motif partner protein